MVWRWLSSIAAALGSQGSTGGSTTEGAVDSGQIANGIVAERSGSTALVNAKSATKSHFSHIQSDMGRARCEASHLLSLEDARRNWPEDPDQVPGWRLTAEEIAHGVSMTFPEYRTYRQYCAALGIEMQPFHPVLDMRGCEAGNLERSTSDPRRKRELTEMISRGGCAIHIDALADIVSMVTRRQFLCNRDYCERWGLSKGEVSKRISAMEDAGLVSCRFEGTKKLVIGVSYEAEALCKTRTNKMEAA